MKAPITFAIAGFGDRGSTYASMQKLFPDRMKVVAVADINPEKVQKAKELYGIKDELCFTSAEEMLTQDKLADISHKPVAVYAVTDRNLAKLCFDRLSDCGAIKNEEDMSE